MSPWALPSHDEYYEIKIHGSTTGINTHLVAKSHFLAHGRDNSDDQVLAFLKFSLNGLAEVALGDFDIVLGGTFSSHQIEETVVDVNLYHMVNNQVKQNESMYIQACIQYG